MRNEKLRTVFEEIGFTNVKTVISSGNVLFETDNRDVGALEGAIEKALLKQLGFHSTTIVRNRPELQKLVDQKPFENDNHTSKNYLTLTFIKRNARFPYKLPYTPEGKAYSFVNFIDNTVFSVVDTTAAKTPDLMTWLEKQFTKDITTRTWKTVLRILQKWD